jgi:heme oxygenase
MIHSKLKQQTSAQHLALESKLHVLMSDDISLNEYAALLKRFHGFYRPIEATLGAIHNWDDPVLELQSRRKLPLLVADLNFLSVDAGEIATLPACADLPPLATIADGLGCLYVLEGSTLGGTFITRHLTKALSLEANRGCSFFNSYGSDVGRMWSGFLGVLARHSEKHGDDTAVVNSACATFAAMDRWLGGCLDRWFPDAA